MFYLKKEDVIGEGNERVCYAISEDRRKCVKINKVKDGERDRPEQSLVEYDYCRYLERKGVVFVHFPRCYGWVETNMGKGLAFERVETFPGGGSLSLRKVIDMKVVEESTIKILVEELYRFLIKNNIMLSDISAENIIVKLDPEPRLYLVDGLGARNFDIKYLSKKYFPILAKRKTKKQWEKYSHKLGIV